MLAASAFLFGSIIGSFLNVLVLRHGARSVSGRSACFSCGRQIAWYDNVPILSWLMLGGRCRSCGSRISIQYPLVEALTAVIFATVAVKLVPHLTQISGSDALALVLHVILVGSLIAIAVYDAKHTIIPDSWAYTAGLAALAIALMTHFTSLPVTLLSGPAAALPLFALWLVSKGTWMGLGDAKLALAIGWFLGPVYGFFAVFFAFVIGAFVSVFILLPMPAVLKFLHEKGIVRSRGAGGRFTMKSEVAFGPFLVASFFITWIALLYGLPLPL